MKKRIALLLASLLLVVSLSSCDMLETFIDGFKEAMGLNVVEVNLFNEGLVPAKSGDKYGFIDNEGNWVIFPVYDGAFPFGADGLAMVAVGEEYFAINSTGASVAGGETAISTGYMENLMSLFYEVDLKYDHSYMLFTNDDGLYGYCDINGSVVIPPKYQSAFGFDEKSGVAIVRLDGRFGLIDKTGSAVGSGFIYENVGEGFCDGLLAVEIDGKWGYINANGEYVAQPQFDDAENFKEGFAVVSLDGRYGYIGKDGKFAIQPQFEKAYDFTEDGIARVRLDGKYGYINDEGKYVVTPRYESARDFSEYYAAVYDDGKWGFITMSGETLVYPRYDDVGEFKNGGAWVERNGVYGFVNSSGDEIVSPQFIEVSDFSENGIAAALMDSGKYGYVNLSGSASIQAIFDGVPQGSSYKLPEGCEFFDDGYAVAYSNGKYGIIDEDGMFAVGPRFDEIVVFWLSW